MLGLAHLEDSKREAVPRRVVLGNGVPATMLDGNPGLLADSFEPYFNNRELVLRKGGLAPCEGEPLAWDPRRDAADFELFAIGQCDHQSPALRALEAEFAVAAGRELEQPVRPPPGPDLLREGFKNTLRRCRDAKRNQHSGCHFGFFSTCVLSEAS